MKKLRKWMSLALAGAMTLAMSVNVFAATAATGVSEEEQRLVDAAVRIAKERGVDTMPEYEDNLAQAIRALADPDLDLTSAEVDKLIANLDSLVTTARAILDENHASSVAQLRSTSPKAYESMISELQLLAAKAAGELNGVSFQILEDGSIALVVDTAVRNGVVPSSEEPASSANPSSAAPSASAAPTSATPSESAAPGTSTGSQNGGTGSQGSSSSGSGDTKPIMVGGSVIKQTGVDIAEDKLVNASSSASAVNMSTTIVLGVMFVGATVACGIVAKKKNLFFNTEV